MTVSAFLSHARAELPDLTARAYRLTDGATRLLVDCTTPDQRNRVISLARHFALSARPITPTFSTCYRAAVDGLDPDAQPSDPTRSEATQPYRTTPAAQQTARALDRVSVDGDQTIAGQALADAIARACYGKDWTR